MTADQMEAELNKLRQEITGHLKTQAALKRSEEYAWQKLKTILSPDSDIRSLELGDIINVKEIQSMMEDFYKLINIPTAIIDKNGKVLVGVGWQNICITFHRVHPETLKNCIESDTELTNGIAEGEFKLYKCKNGMWDLATPLIIGGEQKGNLFMGQFFFDDEPLNYYYFKEQAKRFGFEENEYIKSLEKVPRLNPGELENAKAAFLKIARSITQLSYNNIKLAKVLAEKEEILDSLRQSEERFRAMFEEPKAIMLLIDPVTGNIIDANSAAAEFYGWTREELCRKKIQEINQLNEIEVQQHRLVALKYERHCFIFPHQLADGQLRWVEVYSSPIKLRGKEMLFSIIHDITERKKYQDDLRISEQNIRAILDATQESIFMFDSEGKIISANITGAARIKNKPEEIIGKTLYDLVPLELAQSRYYKFSEVLNSGRQLQFEDERDGIIFSHNLFPVFENRRVVKIVSYSKDITVQKNSEKELTKLYRAVEQSPESIVITNSEGIIEYVNPKFTRITGYSLEEAIGQTPRVLKSGTTKPVIYKNLWATIKSGKEWCGSLQNKKKNGELYWESVNISPVRDADGTITHFVAVKEDITKRKRREEQLFRLNRTLRAIRNSGIAMMRAKNEQDYINEVCKIIIEDCGHAMVWLGFAENDNAKTIKPAASAGFDEGYLEKLNLTWSDAERGRGPTGTAIRTGKTVYCKDMLTDPDFKPWLEEALKRGYRSSIVVPLIMDAKSFGAISIYSTEPHSFSSDEIDLLAELANDLAYGITTIRLRDEHTRAEEELNKYRQHLQNLVEKRTHELAIANEILKEAQKVAHIGHWHLNLSDNSLAWSDEVFKIFGVEKPDFDGTMDSFIRLIHPDDRDYVTNTYRDSVANKTFYNVEHRIIRPDSEIRFVHEQCTTHYNEDGEPVDSLGVVQDITDIKKVQKEIELHRDHLEELVSKRTEELAKANEQLQFEIEKEKQIELLLMESLNREKELNELKSRFISTTSHEFRTPLTSILSSMQLIQRYRKKWEDERLEDQFLKVKNTIFNLTKLLDDILTISHADSGRIIFNAEEIDLEDLCLKLIDEVKHKASEQHDFKFNFNSVQKVFLLDQKLVRFIISNLLSNAFKYSPCGGKVKLKVTVKSDLIKMSVSDQGIGIPPHDLEHLFTPFYRAGNTGDIEGTGLGLSIVKRAVELYNGKITCRSNKDAGTVFIVQIPRKENEKETIDC